MPFNKSRTLQYMKECQLEALIVTSAVNVGYFTGHFCWLDSLFKEYMSRPGASSNLPENYAVATPDGHVVFLVNSLWAANTLSLADVEIRTFGKADLDFAETPAGPEKRDSILDALRSQEEPLSAIRALVDIMIRRGLGQGRIGLEMDGLPHERKGSIIESLPRALIKDCSNLLRLIRSVKSPEELKLMAQSAEIAEHAAAEALNQAIPGISIGEIIRYFHTKVAAENAHFDHFAFSPDGLGIAVESDYKFTGDEVMYVDFGCSYRHYLSDSGLTLALRALPAPLDRRYSAVSASVAAGADAIRPGVKASHVQAQMMREFNAHGFTVGFPHGHGFGLEVREYPILVPETGLPLRDDCIDISSDVPLEEGMVINLEASTFLPYLGSLQVERSFVVTLGGAKDLIKQHRQQPHLRITEHTW